MLTAGMHKEVRTFFVVLLLALAAVSGAAPNDAELTRNISRQLSNLDYGSRRPVVSVKDGVVTISGMVDSLWLKEQTIGRVLKVPGVTSVMSDLMITKAESDAKLAEQVVDKVTHYDLFTVYDDFQGRVRDGVVYLAGAVTEDKKINDIRERIAKIKGVQDIQNRVIVLPANQSDDRLRLAIVNAIYRQPEFERYSMANPPIHVIVNNGHVTLTGVVSSEIDKRKAHEAAAFVNGILQLDDRIQVVGRK